MVEWGTVGAPARGDNTAVSMRLVLLLNVNAGAPIDTCAVARSEEQIPANETRRHTTAFPPSGRGRGGARTKKPTLECYESRSGVQSAPVPTCPTCTAAESSRRGAKVEGAGRGAGRMREEIALSRHWGPGTLGGTGGSKFRIHLAAVTWHSRSFANFSPSAGENAGELYADSAAVCLVGMQRKAYGLIVPRQAQPLNSIMTINGDNPSIVPRPTMEQTLLQGPLPVHSILMEPADVIIKGDT